MSDNRCEHSMMWGDRTDVSGRHGIALCPRCQGITRCITHPDNNALRVAVVAVDRFVDGTVSPGYMGVGQCYLCER